MIGQSAPAFSLPATGNQTISLAGLAGRIVVLYFYPKDNTPGCTKEGEQFRDLHEQFAARDCVVLGISRDSVRTHENFKTKMGFPFELLSDPDEAACQAYGVMKMKNMYGKQVRGIERSTFLIDKQGILRHEWRGVKVPGHAQEVLDTISRP
ncbi:peroxiredoxin [Niveibacterium sp. SC-1]|uniref:peroxiredoxin n=1 Tax=Niveibacterium sp. SC-1 TaxID=3135646 RepID=UPI00311E23A2